MTYLQLVEGANIDEVGSVYELVKIDYDYVDTKKK